MFINDGDTIKKYSIGDIANIFNISTRTLRYYHKKKIFVPEHIDEGTGYRYYSNKQFIELQSIIDMRDLGLSLDEIRIVLNNKDISILEALLSEKIDKTEKEITDLKKSRSLLISWLNSCKHIRTPPKTDSIFIEYISERDAYIFDIEEYDFLEMYEGESPWFRALKNIDSIFINNDMTFNQFYQVGCIILKENLEKRQLLCNGAFIIIDKNVADDENKIVVDKIQQGTYICMYRQYEAMDNKSESIGLKKLLDYIDDHNFSIAGNYYGEIIAQRNIFDNRCKNILVKLQIPIAIPKI